ncbi:hypothetical protein [Sinosporangium siamense]|nr:hypothetical protein [Sinosporangium siamense]
MRRNVAYRWGSIIVPTGYVDYDVFHAAGGNPYGLSRVKNCWWAPDIREAGRRASPPR